MSIVTSCFHTRRLTLALRTCGNTHEVSVLLRPYCVRASALYRIRKSLLLLMLCGVLMAGTLRAQEMDKSQPPAMPGQAIQPPQEPEPKRTDPKAHLRQGNPVVYQSFQPCRIRASASNFLALSASSRDPILL